MISTPAVCRDDVTKKAPRRSWHSGGAGLAKPIKYTPTIWEKVRNVNENNENRY